MNSSPNDSWRSHSGPPGNTQIPQSNQPGVRSLGGYGPNPQQGPQQQVPGPVLPPPTYHPSSQSTGHNLPTIADLTQGPPPSHHQGPSSYNQHAASTNTSHALPGLGPSIPQQSPQTALNRERERELREHEYREREMMERQRQQDELLMRDRERLERDQREREMLERQREQQQQHPVQRHTDSIPIHQPVASKITNNIHGPNGLLSALGSGGPTNQGPSMPSSGGTVNLFNGTGPGPRSDDPARTFVHQPVQPPLNALSGPSPSAMASGQQPILNDALSYLDQVKVRFSDQPDVYNKFLDIMKDFKSQAIDTPGVIGRVSNLFNGHPMLIQGFNTFLPPGYRIECGTDDNPETIRVTTPSGTITQSLSRGARFSVEAADNAGQNVGASQNMFSRSDAFDHGRGWPQSQQQPASSQMPPFSPGSRATAQPLYPHSRAPETPGSFEAQQQDQEEVNAALVHQQQQRGVSQLQNAVSAAANGTAGRAPVMQMSPTLGAPATLAQPPGGLAGVGIPGAQGDMGKRGPVEFNHAISYVNKIKNRFAQQPEIYKNFLEILQTYQRESRPIQDVYAQVTHLFSTAPDLLEDFKQFLPESAAQAKAAAAAKAAAEDPAMNARNEPAFLAGQLPQTQTPRPTTKMPPMGQFDPPSAAKENKKRRGPPGSGSVQQQQNAQPDALGGGVSSQGNRISSFQSGNNSKRTKLHHHKPTQPETISTTPAIDPTIIPALPEPLPPNSSYAAQQDEFTFFDRVRKAVGNKSTYSEFLKLINLFNQDLIDKRQLLDRARPFLDSHPDLIGFFTSFIQVPMEDGLIEARAYPDPGRVNLSHCRSLGPSYRYLPRREQNKMCKGRDEMCYEVLNDEWASYPTWASEDSGFIAHRKNQFEEGLHRIEEERHDYDSHIEACQRTIQLMEPLAQQLANMSETERANFVLHPGLGGQSETIYQRVIKKIYDRERGAKVISEMFARPAVVLPVVLMRLKQKMEEWKHGQREWEKVWREQQNKFYWKSLDHQGINYKAVDKKMFNIKQLTTEILAKYEERKKSLEAGWQVPKHQFKYVFADERVLLDAAKLVLRFAYQDRNTSASEQEKLSNFLRDFVPTFFDVDRDDFANYLDDVSEPGMATHDAGDDDVTMDGASELRSANGKKLDSAQRNVADQTNGKEGTGASQSSTSSPSATDPKPAITTPPDDAQFDTDRWISAPGIPTTLDPREWSIDKPYQRHENVLYCNTHIYAFFRLFEKLYSRLLNIRNYEEHVQKDVQAAMSDKPAHKLGINDKLPSEYFDVTAAFYPQIVAYCEQASTGGQEQQTMLEDVLRRFYLPYGHELYGVGYLLQAITKSISSGIYGNDSKDHSPEILNHFLKNQSKEETTKAQELLYRSSVMKLIKEAEAYKIFFDPRYKVALVQLLPPDSTVAETEDLDDEERWQYYMLSWTMMPPTEGINYGLLRRSSLYRDHAKMLALSRKEDERRLYLAKLDFSKESISVYISPDNYEIKKYTDFEWFRRKETGMEEVRRPVWEKISEHSKEKFEKAYIKVPGWAENQNQDWVEEIKKKYEAWIRSEPTVDVKPDVAMAEA